MRRKGRKAAQRAGNDPDIHAESCSLLELPVEVLHQVLGMLAPEDLRKLLQTSKAMAAEVLQHSAGRFILKVELQNTVKLEAIRQLLHWAPPSTLQLRLDGFCAQSLGDWSELSSQFNLPSTSLQNQPGQQLQQFSCICSVHIKNFRLPSLVPANLAAMCPNMHTLHLSSCMVHGGSSSSTTASSAACSVVSSAIHTLIVEECPVESVRMTTGMQAAIQHAEQLKHSLPGVNCLKLLECSEAGQLVSTFGPQLIELHYEGHCNAPSWQSLGLGPQQHQLQKLVLPAAHISSATDMDQLLSLPSLTHLDLHSVSKYLSKDYSSHPCKWQYLHLRLDDQALWMDGLAKLPLHSLKHPLKLGCKEDGDMQLYLPRPSADSRTRMEHLAQHLRACGVQLVGKRIAWAYSITAGAQLGAEVAPLLALIAPAMGPHAHVSLVDITVDQPILEVLVAVYGSSLQQLDLMFCSVVDASWHAALSGLPSLVSLTLDAPEDTAGLVHALATAMAQQPAGRCIVVVLLDGSPRERAALVKEVVQQEVEEVHITVEDGGALSEIAPDILCFQIARKLVS